jgi:5-formyltetrahydrofolate cyclo-ligase
VFESSKEKVRRALLAKRKQVASEQVRVDSEKCIKNLIELISVSKTLDSRQEGDVIALYQPMPGEPMLDVLSTWLSKKKMKMAFPRLKLSSSEQPKKGPYQMDFCLDNGNWERGPLGILQPGPDAALVLPEDLAGILVPGVGFERSGHRIGMGKGFYDGYLKLAPRAVRMVVTFSFQLLQSSWWRSDPWDEQVDLIATESEAFWVKPERIPRVFAD